MKTYWSNPPKPFLDGWQYSPVPGWGANPRVAGPARVGVGALTVDPSFFRRAMAMQQIPGGGEGTEEPPLAEGETPFPWLYVVAGTLVLGAGTALAYNMGWLKF